MPLQRLLSQMQMTTELNKGSAAMDNNIRRPIMVESYLNSKEQKDVQLTAHFPVV